jgi:hypothetical protein
MSCKFPKNETKWGSDSNPYGCGFFGGNEEKEF